MTQGASTAELQASAQHTAAELQPAAVPVFPDPALVAKTMDAVFSKLKAKPVITRLQELGYSEVYAQKACLLYCARVARPVLETSSLLNWLSFEAKPQDIEKPVTLHDLLEHLDIETAVHKLLQSSPDVSPDTAKLAVTLCLGDIAAAEKLLTTSNDVPAAAPGTTQLEKYLLAVKQNWALPQGVTLPPLAPHTPEPRNGESADSAQMQAAAALLMSASSASAPGPPAPAPAPAPPAPFPSSPPAPPLTPTLTISSAPSACSPSRSTRSTIYSGRKRSSSCNSSSAASSLSSSYPGSPFSTSSGGSAASAFATPPTGPLPSTSAPPHTHSPFSTPSAGVGQGVTLAQQLSACTEPCGWELEKRSLLVQLADLQRHKDWADSRIRDLIRKACEVEKPLAEENRALKDDLAKGEQERGALVGRVRELEGSVLRLEERCTQSTAVRREVERKAAEARAEAQASLLREGELQGQLADLQAQVKNLKRALSAADRQRQKLAEEKAEAEERLEARDSQHAHLRQRLAAAEKLAGERATQLESGEKERSGALAYAHAQAAAWESAYRKSQEEVAHKVQELQLAQARIETLQQETMRQREQVRSVQSELLQAQARLKEAESRPSSGRLFMDGHWSAPDFLGQCGMLGGGSGGGWRGEGARSPSSGSGGDTSSPDAGRVAELEKKVSALRTELELERSKGGCQQRDDRDVHQQLSSSLLHHSTRLLDDRYKPLLHPLHSLATAQCT